MENRFEGIDPPAEKIEMIPIPCKCWIKHEEGDGNYEFFDMKVVTDDSSFQLPPIRTARCKFCREVLLLERQLT